MLDSLFRGLFDSDITVVIRVTDFLLCLGCALLLGLAMAFAYMFRTRYTKSFVVTLVLLPAAGRVGAPLAVWFPVFLLASFALAAVLTALAAPLGRALRRLAH